MASIQPGGSLIVAWQVKGKNALVIGGGDVAEGRVKALLDADSIVTLISPSVTPQIKEYISTGLIKHYIPRDVQVDQDIDVKYDYNIILSAIDDRQTSLSIAQRCRHLSIPVNVADIPDQCDFYFGSMIRSGSLQIMISTNGKSPGLARRIRQTLEKTVQELAIDKAISNVGEIREKLRNKTTGLDEDGNEQGYEPEVIRSRMKWINEICTNWSFQQMSTLSSAQIDMIVDSYPNTIDWQHLKLK